MGLLRTLKPQWWFSAHLHTRYEATVVHGPPVVQDPVKVEGTNPEEIVIDDIDADVEGVPTQGSDEAPVPSISINPDEIKLDEEEGDVVAPPPPPPKPKETKFLALDKCLPRRRFLEARSQSDSHGDKCSDIGRYPRSSTFRNRPPSLLRRFRQCSRVKPRTPSSPC